MLFVTGSGIASVALYAILLLLTPLTGCKTTGRELSSQDFSRVREASQTQRIAGGGWISIFLNIEKQKGPEIAFEVASAELLGNGQSHSLLTKPLPVNSMRIDSGQLFITRNSVPSNSYDSLRLRLRNIAVSGQKQQPAAKDTDDVSVDMKLPAMLTVGEGDSHSLFVTWDVLSSLDEKGEFLPDMTASLQSIPFLSDLLYVACPEIDTIYAIRTDKNWVISSLGIEGNPTYLALDLAADRLYVLTPEKSAIQVVDLVTNQKIDNIFIPADYKPDFMTVSPDRNFAFVLDERGKRLIKVDLVSGSIDNRVTVLFQPRYAVFLDWQQQKLAVSGFDTHNVYFFDAESLMSTGMVAVGNAPEGLLPWNNLLLVAESGTNAVSSYDVNTKQQMERVNVGFAPRRLLLRNEQVYAANFDSGSITLMMPGQLNVFREIFLRGKPLEMLSNESRLWIYVGDEARGGLHVIDSTSNTLSGFISLLTRPAGLAAVD